ncbi:preprotein translocase subunit YajC [Desulfurivibrio sp. C05AmB]|jgi:preprotein translocase subunit YajC|uniref:preprotein translocase subunit YajC n=1 Tax=Desulfurivibrio sp. C05AmB TaxID=3374371 RepID=UPI00376EA878
MVSIAHAAEAAPTGGGLGAFIPLILIFVIFYFLLIRPQQKKAKEHQHFLAALKIGDEVVSSGGLQGTITGLTDTVVTLEIADKVRVKVARPYIMGPANRDLGMAKPAGS